MLTDSEIKELLANSYDWGSFLDKDTNKTLYQRVIVDGIKGVTISPADYNMEIQLDSVDGTHTYLNFDVEVDSTDNSNSFDSQYRITIKNFLDTDDPVVTTGSERNTFIWEMIFLLFGKVQEDYTHPNPNIFAKCNGETDDEKLVEYEIVMVENFVDRFNNLFADSEFYRYIPSNIQYLAEGEVYIGHRYDIVFNIIHDVIRYSRYFSDVFIAELCRLLTGVLSFNGMFFTSHPEDTYKHNNIYDAVCSVNDYINVLKTDYANFVNKYKAQHPNVDTESLFNFDEIAVLIKLYDILYDKSTKDFTIPHFYDFDVSEEKKSYNIPYTNLIFATTVGGSVNRLIDCISIFTESGIGLGAVNTITSKNYQQNPEEPEKPEEPKTNPFGLAFTPFKDIDLKNYSEQFCAVFESIIDGNYIFAIPDENNNFYNELMKYFTYKEDFESILSPYKDKIEAETSDAKGGAGNSSIATEAPTSGNDTNSDSGQASNDNLTDAPALLNPEEIELITSLLQYQYDELCEMIGYKPLSSKTITLVPKWVAEQYNYISQIKSYFNITDSAASISTNFLGNGSDDYNNDIAEPASAHDEYIDVLNSILSFEYKLNLGLIYHLDYINSEFFNSMLQSAEEIYEKLYVENISQDNISQDIYKLYASTNQMNTISLFVRCCYFNTPLMNIVKSIESAINNGFLYTDLRIELFDLKHINTIRLLLINLGMKMTYSYQKKYQDYKYTQFDEASKIYIKNYLVTLRISWEDDILTYTKMKAYSNDIDNL